MESIDKTNEIQGSCGCGCDCETKVEKVEEKAPRRAYVPAVDLIEGENEVYLIADVPGVPEGGVDLSVEKNILTLKAVPEDGVVAGKKLSHSEYGVGEYRRSFVLSENVDRENITATLKDGVLRVTLPKAAPATRKISVAGA